MPDNLEIFRYEQLTERGIKAQENSVAVQQALLDVSKSLQGNIKELNDNFILHNQCTIDTRKDVTEIRETFMKWLKVLIVALFLVVGGTTTVRLLTQIDWGAIIKF